MAERNEFIVLRPGLMVVEALEVSLQGLYGSLAQALTDIIIQVTLFERNYLFLINPLSLSI
jgi:hypothetical protein